MYCVIYIMYKQSEYGMLVNLTYPELLVELSAQISHRELVGRMTEWLLQRPGHLIERDEPAQKDLFSGGK